jgi:Acyl-CoA reductase (LuxC)
MSNFKVPLVIRGEIIEDYEIEYADRNGGMRFKTPDVKKYVGRLVNDNPISLLDMYEISLDEIVDFLDAVGKRLDLDTNSHWREAFDVSCLTSNLSRSVLETAYRGCTSLLSRDRILERVEAQIGARYLEGWVPTKLNDGRVLQIRAMGARGVHIIAGNVPIVSASTLIRSAITRSDTIVKVPSNDPLTMGALARTMIDIDPKHPLTRHLSVAYWKGGDESVEREIYKPNHIEKIVAWGGFASVKHISKYLQPGIDLITLDPKNSTTLIGREALRDDLTMRATARRVACDLGGWDQEACVCARVMFIECGTDAAGIAAANRFGQYIFEALQLLPSTISNGPVHFDPELKAEIDAIMPLRDFYRIYCDPNKIEKSGAVIVSQMSEQVDFPQLLYGRVGNLVPLDRIEDAMERFTSATQTVGFYPDSLKLRLRERAALSGAQKLTPIGYAVDGTSCGPQDGIEPERRMVRWIVDTHVEPGTTPGPWMHPDEVEKVLAERALQRQSLAVV